LNADSERRVPRFREKEHADPMLVSCYSLLRCSTRDLVSETIGINSTRAPFPSSSFAGNELPKFKKKKDVVGLQAADLLAWENFNTFNTGKIRESLDQIRGSHISQHYGSIIKRGLLHACETNEVPKRDPTNSRKFSCSAHPKIARLREITDPPHPGQITGIDRIELDRPKFWQNSLRGV
jgi:hypothetical protein